MVRYWKNWLVDCLTLDLAFSTRTTRHFISCSLAFWSS